MIYVQGGSAALDPGILETIIPFAESTTWTAPFSGYAVFIAIGGGGAGGAVSNTNGSGIITKAAGGGAGGFAMQRILVTAGETYAITVGSGGAGSTQVTGGSAAGGNGTASSVVGLGINMIAGGGFGGAVAFGTSPGIAAGGAGGVASGGDVNYAGGAGGSVLNVQTLPSPQSYAFAAGGGSVAPYGIVPRGADLANAALSFPAQANRHASGGAGINANGIDILTYPNPSTGGLGGGSAGGSNILLPSSTLTVFAISFGALFGFTSFVGSNGVAPIGGASTGTAISGSGAGAGDGTFSATSGSAQIGGGSGGAATASLTGAQNATSGNGGRGLVIVRLTRNA